MPRRVHVAAVTPGEILLSSQEAHHLRDVLRLSDGAVVEVFDDAGHVAAATVSFSSQSATAHVQSVETPADSKTRIVIASALPKGNRADWMIEKLSELGVHAFIPLIAQRSVVHPEGKNKLERWRRIATEAAKQSRRAGVMRIENVSPLETVLQTADANDARLFGSTGPDAKPLAGLEMPASGTLTVFIGPEGDWTEEELAMFDGSHVQAVSLGKTIMRIETAALAAAAILQAYLDG